MHPPIKLVGVDSCMGRGLQKGKDHGLGSSYHSLKTLHALAKAGPSIDICSKFTFLLAEMGLQMDIQLDFKKKTYLKSSFGLDKKSNSNLEHIIQETGPVLNP